jgi:hypothetical protein
MNFFGGIFDTKVYLYSQLPYVCPYCKYEPMYLGFPFYVKKLFTRNTVTDVTDGYYVGITIVIMT